MFDTVIKGGRVIDPSQAIDGVMDVGFAGGTTLCCKWEIGVAGARILAEPLADNADVDADPVFAHGERLCDLLGGDAFGVQGEVGEELDVVRLAAGDRSWVSVRRRSYRSQQVQLRYAAVGIEPGGDVFVERGVEYLG